MACEVSQTPQAVRGTVRLLQHVHIRRSVYGLLGPALILRPRRAGDLPVLVHVVSQRARVLTTTQDRTTTRELTRLPCCLPPHRNGVGILIFRLFEAQSPGPPMPLSTLRLAPRDATRKTRGQDGFATSYPAGLLPPLQHAGLAGALRLGGDSGRVF